MHPTLTRQLKRLLPEADIGALPALLSELSAFLERHEAPTALHKFAAGLPDLFTRIDSSYQQLDRDLALRSRSLRLSSDELLGINQTLRQTLASREQAISELQRLLDHLQGSSAAIEATPADGDQQLTRLVSQVSALIARQEADQARLQALHADLANQKFAMDQHAIVSITDLQGTILYANDRFCEITGYSREELIGANHRLVNSGHHPADFFAQMWQTLSSGQVWRGEIKNRAKDGHYYWVAATIVPMLDANGLPYQYIAIRTDITERKAMEEKLAEQLHFTEILIESLPTGLYLKDRAGRYLQFNRAFEELFGIERQAWLGRTVFELVDGETAAFMHAKDEELFREGGIQTYEAPLRNHRNGELREGLYHKVCLSRPDGSIWGLLGSVSDITERKRAEAELQIAKRAAEAASRAKSEFLANMSHEIRTPMNGIIGMTELALDTELSPIQREYLSIVQRSAQSLMSVVNDILDFSKIEAGKLSIEQTPFDIAETLADALKSIAGQAERKGLRLAYALPAELDCIAEGDPVRIRQVLTNLCDNAIKFTETGVITVRAWLEPGYATRMLWIEVSDTGIGIPADKQQQIFDAFAQADSSTTRRFGGTGLGLAICMRLVRLMGGKIEVDSEPGQGSRFRFSVQLRDSGNTPACTTPGKGARALIADSLATNRRTLAGWLLRWGFQVDEASDGTMVRELCAKQRSLGQRYAMLLIDDQLCSDEISGLIEQLGRDDPGLPERVLLLGLGSKQTDLALPGADPAALLSKPPTPQELLDASLRLCPVASPAAAGERGASRATLPAHTRSLSILLVEDNPINEHIATQLLQKWGHQVRVARDGQQAVELFPTQHWDVVFMDMQLPVLSGIEATTRIRAMEAAGQHTPIIAMTANAMQEDRDSCLAAGMDEHMAKPLDFRAIHAMLERLCADAPARLDLDAPAATAVPAGIDRTVIDAAIATIDPEMLEAIRHAMIQQLQDDLNRAEAACATQDWDTLRRAAHNLKSSFALFELDALTQLAQQLESHPSVSPQRQLEALQAAAALIVDSLTQNV